MERISVFSSPIPSSRSTNGTIHSAMVTPTASSGAGVELADSSAQNMRHALHLKGSTSANNGSLFATTAQSILNQSPENWNLTNLMDFLGFPFENISSEAVVPHF